MVGPSTFSASNDSQDKVLLMVKNTKWAMWGLALLLGGASGAMADVKPAALFSDHMVLQRDASVPVWGTASPNEAVTVSFRGQSKSTTADKEGKWSVKLDALTVGEPGQLVIKGNNTLTLNDVLVGEVWVGSGQSNMAGGAGGYAKGDEVLATIVAETHPQLRLYRNGWRVSGPDTNPGFSALMLSFGVRLQEQLKVPVGIMVGAVGGTPSGFWLSEEAFKSDPACAELVRKGLEKQDLKAKEAAIAKWEKDNEERKKNGMPPLGKPTTALNPGESTGKIGGLYQTFIKPFQPFGIRGVLWDQGESGTAIAGVDQYTLMGALIRGWRKEWGQGDFPFIYVQKESGAGCAIDPSNPMTNQARKFTPLPATVPGTAEGLYAETHIRIREYPLTAMATSTDLGQGVHPTNKSGYGARSAHVAMGLVYGGKEPIYGPTYKSHTVEGSSARVRFDNVGQGLVAAHAEQVQGFAIAGEDKVFHWATAKVDGDAIVLSSDKVAKPVAIRYAWGKVHPWANLFNKNGLPALTFRTDSW